MSNKDNEIKQTDPTLVNTSKASQVLKKHNEFKQTVTLDRYIDTVFSKLHSDTHPDTNSLIVQFQTLTLPKEASFLQTSLSRLSDAAFVEMNILLEFNKDDVEIDKSFIFDYLKALYEKNLKVANSSELHISDLYVNYTEDDLDFITGLWHRIIQLRFFVGVVSVRSDNLLGTVKSLQDLTSVKGTSHRNSIYHEILTSGFNVRCLKDQGQSTMSNVYTSVNELNKLVGQPGKEQIEKFLPATLPDFVSWVLSSSAINPNSIE